MYQVYFYIFSIMCAAHARRSWDSRCMLLRCDYDMVLRVCMYASDALENREWVCRRIVVVARRRLDAGCWQCGRKAGICTCQEGRVLYPNLVLSLLL